MTPSRTVIAVLLGTAVGCHAARNSDGRAPTPLEAGVKIRDVVDPIGQPHADAALANLDMSAAVREAGLAARARAGGIADVPRNVLCLSGGGSYGAYSAGVLCGWTRANCRPNFDVVTGISTGALIAPLAFLGPKYDDDVRKFYTETRSKDVYITRPVRGLFRESFADNSPLRGKVEGMVTQELVNEIAAAHASGRRLYIGTTELEARRFIVWDLGGIASRGLECDRALICDILVASAAIPGFFPPVRIPVNVNGRTLIEKHGDGGASQAIFFRPPWPPDLPVAGTRIWCIIAGKLYADAAAIKPRAISLATSSVTDIIYAQTRGDLQRIYTLAKLNGMEYRTSAIPENFPAPAESTEFEPTALRAMFDEGYRRSATGRAWRDTPPGLEPGEAPQERAGTSLIEVPGR